MACRCNDMNELTNKIDKLKAVLEKNTSFNDNNISAVEQLGHAKDNSWRATKSTCVQKNVIVLPEMTDVLVNSKKYGCRRNRTCNRKAGVVIHRI